MLEGEAARAKELVERAVEKAEEDVRRNRDIAAADVLRMRETTDIEVMRLRQQADADMDNLRVKARDAAHCAEHALRRRCVANVAERAVSVGPWLRKRPTRTARGAAACEPAQRQCARWRAETCILSPAGRHGCSAPEG